MPTNPIKIFIDRQLEKLVSYNGSVTSIPQIGQNELRDLQVQFGDPTGGISNPYNIVNMSAYSLVVSVGLQPLGDGSVSRLTFNPGLTFDTSANQWFAGQIDFRPAGITTALGTKPNIAMVMEFQVTFGGIPTMTVQVPITVIAVENQGAATPAIPGETLLTLSQAKALFVPWTIPQGQAITWQTADPTKVLLESVDNNQKKQEVPVTI